MGTLEFRWIFMPYCIQRLKDGRYIVLNRDYKPLGIQTREWVDYETQPSAAKIEISKETAQRLSWEGKDNLDTIFLYNDGCVPTGTPTSMQAYLARLAILSTLKIMVDR